VNYSSARFYMLPSCTQEEYEQSANASACFRLDIVLVNEKEK
jgi:hypothetical protein